MRMRTDINTIVFYIVDSHLICVTVAASCFAIAMTEKHSHI